MSTAPDRIGDTIVAGVSRTGTAEPRAPLVANRTAARTTTPATGRPITNQRRAPGVGAAGSAARSIRSAERSAFFASMALNPNTRGNPAATRTLSQLTLECHAPAGSGGGLPSTGPRAAGVFSRVVPSADGAAGAGGGGGARGEGLPAPAHPPPSPARGPRPRQGAGGGGESTRP